MTKQSNKNKFLATAVTATMVATAFAPVASVAAAETTFPDVDPNVVGQSSADAVAALAEAGIIKGIDGQFKPGASITRAEASQMVAKLFDLKTGQVKNETTFEDVKDNAWYTGAINSLVEKDILKGKSEKSFEPGSDIKRSELALVLVKAYGLQDVNVDDVKLPYTDVKAGSWYEKSVKILYKEGLLKGTTATTFSPDSPMKRVDFARLAVETDYAHGTKLPKPEETVELAVESVSAITKTQITVTIKALTEAKENYTFEVKDNNGKDVAVKEIAVLDVGETEATITFVTALTTNPTGKWTVNGVEFDADAQAAVEAVKNAGNQVALLNALKSPYFKDVNEKLISEYDAKDFTNAETVADVQKIIDEVNKENISADAVEKVNEAKNQVELLKALQDGGFARVNADLIKEYAEEDADTDGTADYKEAADADAVQKIIDDVNKKAADNAVLAAADKAPTALTAKAIADAQALVNALPEKEDAEKAAKKALQDRLDLANAVAKVKAATTQASLLSALKAPVLDLKNIDDKLAKFYKAEFDKATGKAAITNVTYELQKLIVDEGKKAAIADTAKKISEVTDKTTTADLKALLTELKRLDGTTFTEDIIDALLEDYRDALVAKTTVTEKDNTSKIHEIIQATNDPATALTTLVDAGNALDDADKLLKALKAKTLNLKNINDANKDAYFKDITSIKTAAGTDAAAIQKAVNSINFLVDANTATTATGIQTALTGLAVNQSVTKYVNLSTAAKLEVAELVLAAREKQTDKKFATVNALAENDTTGVLATTTTAYADFLTEVNSATDIGTMKTALDKAELPSFQELDGVTKVAKAEAVYNKLVEIRANDKAPAVTNFKTIAEIKAAAGL